MEKGLDCLRTCLFITFWRSLETHSSKISPVPLTKRILPVSSSNTLNKIIVIILETHSKLFILIRRGSEVTILQQAVKQQVRAYLSVAHVNTTKFYEESAIVV